MIPLTSRGRQSRNVNSCAAFQPEIERLADIVNEKTGRAYKINMAEFSEFLGLKRLEDVKALTWAHVIA